MWALARTAEASRRNRVWALARTAEASEVSPPDGAGVKRVTWWRTSGLPWQHS